MSIVTKPRAAENEIVVHDAKSGRLVTVRGAGALKGRLTLNDGMDLTKPIAAQAGSRPRKGGSGPAKH